MLRRGVALGEEAGAFHHHVDIELTPGQLGGIALRQHFHKSKIAEIEAVGPRLDLAGDAAMHRVPFQQMSVRLNRAQIVDGDEFEIAPACFIGGAQHQPPDTPEPVDGNPNGHSHFSLVELSRLRPGLQHVLSELQHR
jgi:hypothetical protein